MNYFTLTDFFKKIIIHGKEKKKFLDSSIHTIPTAIADNVTITNAPEIANAFSKCFTKVAIDIQSSIRFSNRKYSDYLPTLNIESFFITPTDSTEISNIVSLLNQDMSDRPNSIPTRILKFLNKDISDQLAFLLNHSSFYSGLFPSIFENQKHYTNIQKGSKLHCLNYGPIFLLSSFEKFLERLMHNRFYNFLDQKRIHIYSPIWYI